jgi:hypothetical protein
MKERPLNRRGILARGAFALSALPVAMAGGAQSAAPRDETARMISAAEFGAVGDGVADDSLALQEAFDAVFKNGAGGGFLLIPPGTYRVTRTLHVLPQPGSDITRHSGIIAHGARIRSAIADGGNVIEIVSRATVRFLLVEGIDILGLGKEGAGIYLECDSNEHYLYNCCLRDVVVQQCGGDGCRMVGNVFESQVFNSYFRKNGGNGVTFSHGIHGGILSAIHVFGCIFGDNAVHGAAMVRQCYDVAFHGCYFLLNGEYGLDAENGCTLLSNCGFENNHTKAADFAHGDAGIRLNSFGTLVGCTAYSMFNQTRLLRAFITAQVTLVGCDGAGDGPAKGAGLALLDGATSSLATLIGCRGAIETSGRIEAVEFGSAEGGVRFGADWQSRILPRLGDYRLWIDQAGRLRMKKGAPNSDEDGTPLGS